MSAPPGEEKWQLTTDGDRSDAEVKRFIETHNLVWRFCLYGAFKNLQFFEAFLLVILLDWGCDLFQIGILNAIIHSLTYLFEVPSGVIADTFGKKNELLLCFVFYMISFSCYALAKPSSPDVGGTFGVLIAASIFYGLGEAFRSGTHKAMIMMWLDRHGLSAYKTFIYSRTRSFSNLGSAANAILSVVIILTLNYQLVFVISVLPFIADFLMVSTYPSYMNETPDAKQSFTAIMGGTCAALRDVLHQPIKRKPLLSAAAFQAVFATLKHYIQPIMVINGANSLARWGISEESRPACTKVIIGVLYATFYLCSAVGTRNSHKLKCVFTSDKMAMDVLFNLMLLVVLATGLSVYLGAIAATLPLYLVLYVVQNLWKPWSLAAVSDLMGKKRRATVLSVESLLESVLAFMLAPLVGYVAETLSVSSVFLGLGSLFLVINNLALSGDWGSLRAPEVAKEAPNVELATAPERAGVPIAVG